jgi:hypothetical protein
MSSLQGAAITSVQIDNVLHEFSSSPACREDVTDIVLNLKGVALRMEADGPKRLSISAKGPQGRDRRRHLGKRRHRGAEQGSRDLPPRRWRGPVSSN